MKKLLLVLAAVGAAFMLVACEPASDENNDYYVTGNMAGWAGVIEREDAADFKMEPVKKSDSRLKSMKAELKDATFVYIIEVTFSDDDPGWGETFEIDGVEKRYHGNLTVKVIGVEKDNDEPQPVWIPDPHTAEVKNLTPATLYIPPWVEEVTPAGSWANNPVVLEAGTYIFVYAQFSPVLHGFGAIKKQ